ncbi:MAG: hypothetical protein SH857_16610 [Chitinophagales bacterium]|nr:hypothetical protein [Chitinophagales bacterium]
MLAIFSIPGGGDREMSGIKERKGGMLYLPPATEKMMLVLVLMPRAPEFIPCALFG